MHRHARCARQDQSSRQSAGEKMGVVAPELHEALYIAGLHEWGEMQVLTLCSLPRPATHASRQREGAAKSPCPKPEYIPLDQGAGAVLPGPPPPPPSPASC